MHLRNMTGTDENIDITKKTLNADIEIWNLELVSNDEGSNNNNNNSSSSNTKKEGGIISITSASRK